MRRRILEAVGLLMSGKEVYMEGGKTIFMGHDEVLEVCEY